MGAMAAGVPETSFVSDEAFTQEGFRRWLEQRPSSDIHHYELIGGRIVMSPPAGAWNGRIGVRLGSLLERHASSRSLGPVFDSSTGYELPGGETLEPDVSFISRERWEAGPHPGRNDFLRIVPSLVIEILSPSTARRDRTEKLDVYARSGVDEYWIVDPARREIAVHLRADEGFAAPIVHASGVVGSRVLPDLDARIEDVFADVG